MTQNQSMNELSNLLETVDGWLTKREAYYLFLLAKTLPADGEIVEIGSYVGKSTIALAKGIASSGRSQVVWAIDPHEGVISLTQQQKATYQTFLKNIKKAGIDELVSPLVMTSQQASKRWKKYIKLLFIDGLHDYQNVQSDIAYWSPYVVRGGVIAFHDGFCGQRGVEQAIVKHIFSRHDIVNIAAVSSILSVEFGMPTFRQALVVFLKKQIYKFSILLNMSSIPWSIKIIILHRVCKVLLMTTTAREVYKKT
jgi:predicted O-methyltransferase YrrM